MGWCKGTEIFDEVCDEVLGLDIQNSDKQRVIERLVMVMWEHDWDCEGDSAFFTHPIVEKIFKKYNPEWYEEE